jgi:hypothetical protein
MHPDEHLTFKAVAFDKLGRPLGEAKVDKWEVGKLVVPPPPARPKELMRTNSAAAAAGNVAANKPAEAAPPPPRPTGPTLVGNLQGTVDSSGQYTAPQISSHNIEGGGVIAHAGKLEGVARVRVFPPLPWKMTFENAPIGKPPLTWIGAGMKFAVREEPGNPQNKVLKKLTDIPLFARARTYLGETNMANYTIQADVKVMETVYNDNGVQVHKMPDAGVIDSRYVLELKGSKQTLGLYAWPAALPRNELLPGLATHKTIEFPWKAGQWYTLKLTVQQESGKAVLHGKAWEKGQPEPQQWTIELEDPTPNTHGAAGLWGFSNDHEIDYDNIIVTPNSTAAAAQGPARQNQVAIEK